MPPSSYHWKTLALHALPVCAVLIACGGTDGQSAQGEFPGTTVTVEIESGTELISIESIEYTIICVDSSEAPLGEVEGDLELSGVGPDPEDPTEVWRTFADLPPSTCTIQLRARDGDGEVICR